MTAWPLIGRSRQLDRLLQVMTAGGGGLVVAGPAGIGKTRLLDEARRRGEAAGVAVHWAVATAAATEIPFGALAHLLPARAGADDLAATLTATTAKLLGGGTQRVAVTVDDAQLLDAASSTLLLHLAANTRVAVVATVRTGEVTVAAWAWWRDLERLQLVELDEAGVAEALTVALGGPVDSALLSSWFRLSQGNPLLLRELVDGALATDAIEQRRGVWQAVRQLVAATTLPAVIAARLDRLDAPVRAAAELVAMAEPMEAAVLERLLPPDVVAALDSERLLATVPDRRRQQVGAVHPLYAEALRATVPPLRARDHRRRLADALAATGARRRGDRVRLAVWHLEAGVRDDPDLFLAGAREAAGGLEHDLAGRLAQAAVDAGGSFDAQLVLLQQLPYQGRVGEALDRAEALEREELSDDHRVRLAILRSNLHLIVGRVGAAGRVLDAAIARVTHQRSRVRLELHRAGQAFAVGNVAECLALGGRVLDATGSDPAVVERMAVARVRALANAGRTADAIALADQTLGGLDAEALNGPRAAQIRMARLQAVAFHGDVHDALAMAEAGVAGTRSGPAATLRAFWTHELGQTLMLSGRPRSARRWLRETLAVMPVEGLPATAQLWGTDGLAEANALLGDADDAARQAERLRAILPPGFTVPKRNGSIWAVAASGELSQARDLARAHADELQQVGALFLAAWVLHDAARLGAATQVAADLDDLVRRCQGRLAPALAGSATALARGDAGALDEAAAELAALGCDLLAAEAAAEASRRHREAGRLGSALSSAARADRLAAACEGARTPLLDAPRQPDPLTAREREVAGLAARGLSDRAIAARLHLSVRTVQSHLYRSYRKLGIGDRSDLMAVFTDPVPATREETSGMT